MTHPGINIIPSADKEILVTNLDSHDATVADLKELYNLTWGVEILIDRLKNVLEIEHFSGTRLIAVEQDIFTSAITYNIASVIQRMTSLEYYARHLHRKPMMYRYKPNLSVIIGTLCFYMPKLAEEMCYHSLHGSLRCSSMQRLCQTGHIQERNGIRIAMADSILSLLSNKLFKSDDGSVYLSGNGPLVAALTEALARDNYKKFKERGDNKKLSDSRREVSKFIQIIHR